MSNDPVSTNRKPLLNTAEAAARTPFQKGYLDKLRMKGEGPGFFRIGTRVYYDPDVLDRWLDQHRVEPQMPRLSDS